LLLVPAHVQVAMVGTPVREPVDQPRVAVVGEDDRTVGGEQRVELLVRQAVRVLARRLQAHQVHHVDDAYREFGQVLVEQVGGGEYLQGRYVAGAGQHHVGVLDCGTGPVPDPDAGPTVPDRLVDAEPLRFGLLAGNDDVDV